MFRLEILSGRKAGFTCEARHFPFGVGRSVTRGLQVNDFGVGEHHMDLVVQDGRLSLVNKTDATTLCNYEPVLESIPIRNGDVISAGALSFRIVLGDIAQKQFSWHSRMAIVLVLIVTVVQLFVLLRFWT